MHLIELYCNVGSLHLTGSMYKAILSFHFEIRTMASLSIEEVEI